MKQLRKWDLTICVLRSMVARKILILLFILSSIPFFAASAAWCASFSSDSYYFGWMLVGTNKCVTTSWFNLIPGGTVSQSSNGWLCTPTPSETVTFSTTGTGFSVTPSTPVVVPGCTSANLNVCVSPSLGDTSGTLTATVSPAYVTDYGQWTIASTSSLHVKGIPSLVTCEPLGSSLTFGSAQVGQIVSKTFSVCNYNSFSVTINSISIDNNNFTVASGANALIPSESCSSVGINFNPQTIGTINANIQVNTTAQNPTYTCFGKWYTRPYCHPISRRQWKHQPQYTAISSLQWNNVIHSDTKLRVYHSIGDRLWRNIIGKHLHHRAYHEQLHSVCHLCIKL